MKNAILIILALCAFAPEAHADWMSSTLNQPLTEVSHSVRVQINEGIGTFVVQRTFANAGDIPDEAVLWLDLPRHAVATGLRIRAGQKWYTGDLLEAEEAARKYEELTGIGVSTLKDPALLAWVSSQNLELRVFPVPVGGTATLEYTVSAPANWSNGRWVLDYPRRSQLPEEEGGQDLKLAPIVMTLESNKEHSQTFVDGQRVTFAQPVVLQDFLETTEECEIETDYDDCYRSQTFARIEAKSSKADAIVARAGSTIQADRRTVFGRVQLELPQKLSKTPDEAHVIFVVDRSYSVLYGGMVATQFQMMRAFAEHLPGGKFEVILTDRIAERLSEDFMGQQDFIEVISLVEEADLEFKNGSHMDEGLRAARELLKDKTGTRYIIAFTDDLLRTALLPVAMEQKSDIITHVVVMDSMWHRDDDHRLAPIAHKGGGLLVHAVWDDTLPKFVEHLVRPVMLEAVRVEGVAEHSETLWEGTGFVDFSDYETIPAGLGTLRGKLWHANVTVGPKRRAEYDRATAGWVFSHDLHAFLSDEEMMKLALYARAVSPVTSYLAIEPGVRPSTQGLPMMARGMGMRGFGASSHGTGTIANRGENIDGLLAALKEVCRQQHPDQTGSLSVHSTRDEVVDVVAYSSNTMTTCMVDGIWNFRLPSDYIPFRYQRHPVQF